MYKLKIKRLRERKEKITKIGILACLFVIIVPFDLLRGILISVVGLCIFGALTLKGKIARLEQEEKEDNDIDKMNEVRALCVRKIKLIEFLYASNGYSTRPYENYIIDELYEILNSHCNTVRAYKYFLKDLDERTEFVKAFVRKNKHYNEEKSNDNSSYRNTYEREQEENPITKYLKVLNLPADTTDMELIKKTFRTLIKKYHGDVNGSKEAQELSREIIEAYQALDKHFKKVV